MSNLLRALQNPPFGWVVAWEDTDELGRPLENREAALRQPDRIKVKFDIPDGGVTRQAGTREATAEITPDKGLFGAEYALVFTIPEFEKKIRARLDSTTANFAEKLFGKALVKWKDVLSTKHMPVADRTELTFAEALCDYLEAVANLKNLGDCLIRQKRSLKKPVWLDLDA